MGAAGATGWFKTKPIENSPAKLATVGISCFVLLVLFGVVIAHSDDTCMANAQLGLNLTWWTGINCFAAFVLVLLAAYVLKAIRIAWFIGIFFVPWHVIGFILFTTSQNSCITNAHGVGIAAVFIFLVDVLLIVAALVMYLGVTFKGRHRDPTAPQKSHWRKATLYLTLAVGLFSVIGVGIGSSYLNDSCLTPDPTGINLAQWILTISTVTFVFFVIVAVIGAVVNLHSMCTTCCNCYMGHENDNLHHADQMTTWITAIWAVFLIVWVPLGIFLVASTQASCVTGSSSGHAALTTGFIFSLFLPLIAIYSIDHYTERIFNFESLGEQQS